MRSLRQPFQQQSLIARQNRAVRRRQREIRRALQRRERQRRLAHQWAVHRHRLADRKLRIEEAQRERVRSHRAMLARRQARLLARRTS